jgi:hypothetical protein
MVIVVSRMNIVVLVAELVHAGVTLVLSLLALPACVYHNTVFVVSLMNIVV